MQKKSFFIFISECKVSSTTTEEIKKITDDERAEQLTALLCHLFIGKILCTKPLWAKYINDGSFHCLLFYCLDSKIMLSYLPV
jgi:hypothetical protein